uniref:Intercellular adhesion molecule 1-like n=2 Tax=Cyprinodon variegatus TaxID=28743 RepID=A0A3Q2DZI5_CYPVA
MSPSFMFLLVGLLSALRWLHVSACGTSCPDKPVLTPSRLVVKYGDPASATCVACQRDCLPVDESVIAMEVSEGERLINGTIVNWTVGRLTAWDSEPKCYYTDKNDKQCCSRLSLTVYQPPKSVSISLNQSGPLTEHTEYILQCSVQEVAPIEKLVVTFYKGNTQLGSMRGDSTQKPPVNKLFTLSFNTSKEHNGAQFWCDAKLELGPEGPQPPPAVKSNNLTATVHYGPELKVSADPDPITITRGNTLNLTCLAEGNPEPSYSWTLPSNKGYHSGTSLTVQSVDYQDEGEYVCTVSSKLKTIHVKFNVQVQKNIWLYIIIATVVAVALLLTILAIFYFFYYKHNKMGKYQLKDVFRLGTVHHTAIPLSA